MKRAIFERPKGFQKTRFFVQLASLIFVVMISVGHYLVENGIMNVPGTASLHAICPFGGVANIYTFFATGDYVQKLHQSDFVMLLALLVGLVATGAFFCGWICPLGTVQEWLGKLGRKIFGKFYNRVPKKIDRILKFGKYAMLAFVIVQTARTATLVFEAIDPFYNLFNIWTDEIALTGYIVVAATLAASLFVERPFCRYACPLGAVNGLFNSVSLTTIKRDAKTCINCGRCDSACPVGINVSKKFSVKGHECTRCMKCVDSCPVNKKGEDTLKVRYFFGLGAKKAKKPILGRGFYTLLIIGAFVVPIIVSQAAGLFVTERIKTYETTSDIRGSSTIAEVVENYGISKGLLYNSFAIPQDVSEETKLKDLGGIMGIPEDEEIVSPEYIRIAVDEMNGTVADFAKYAVVDPVSEAQKYGLSATSTVKKLMAESRPGLIAYLLTGKWPVQPENQTETTAEASAAPASPAVTAAASETAAASVPVDIKGSTTLGDIKGMVADYGAFLKSFGIPEDAQLTSTLKDLKDTYNFEILSVRDYVEKSR